MESFAKLLKNLHDTKPKWRVSASLLELPKLASLIAFTYNSKLNI